jgi:hypothetical protein
VSLGLRNLKLFGILAGLLIALPAYSGDVPSPVVPKAKAKATEEYGCVEPVKVMRKNHMKFLLHQRDETMHRGIRTRKYSLAECINCHITKQADGKYARFGDDKFFCSSCHNYASVKIDCFECHRDSPQPEATGLALENMPNPHHKLVLNQQAEVAVEEQQSPAVEDAKQ